MVESIRHWLLTLVFLGVALSSGQVAGKILNSNDRVKYHDCEDLRIRGKYNQTGEYQIFFNESVSSFPAVCQFFKTGSTVTIMQQKYGRVSFMQNWTQYRNGFGKASEGDFWIGLENIVHYSSRGFNRLMVTLQDWNNVSKTIEYGYFKVLPEQSNYTLNIGDYKTSGILPDDLSQNNGRPFATEDKPDTIGCANRKKSGWWYGNFTECTYALPTGRRSLNPQHNGVGTEYMGMYYSGWHGFYYSLQYLRMYISNF